MRSALSTCFLVFLTVAATTSQERPDFSGRWILVNPDGSPSNVPRTLSVEASFRRQSVNGTPINPPLVTLRVEPRFGNAIKWATYLIGTSGGVVGGLSNERLRTESRHSTRWDDDKLVVDFAEYADGKLTSEHREVWSLDGQGTLSIAVTDRIVGDAQTTTNLSYRRQP